MKEVEITHNDEIGPTSADPRALRLSRVLGYVKAISELEGEVDFLSKIKRLHDHKGILKVIWSNRVEIPTKYALFFQAAWEGECEETVEHCHEFSDGDVVELLIKSFDGDRC